MDKVLLRPYRARKKPWTLELDEQAARLWNDHGELVLALPRAEFLACVKAPGFWDISSNIEISGPNGKYTFLGEKAPLRVLQAYRNAILFENPEAVQDLKTRASRNAKRAGSLLIAYVSVVVAVLIFNPDPLGFFSEKPSRIAFPIVFLLGGAMLLKSLSDYRLAAWLEKQQQTKQ